MLKNKIVKQTERILFSVFKRLYASQSPIFRDFINDEWWKINTNWASHVVFTEEFLENWAKFYFENKDNIGEIFDKFSENMDMTSVEIAQALWERNVFFLPRQKVQNLYLYNTEKFLTSHELEERKNFDFFDKGMWRKLGGYYKFGFSYAEDKIQDYVKGRDFVDGGAFDGDSSKVLLQYNPKKIYAFELSPETFKLLQNSAAEEKSGTIIPKNSALYSYSGEIGLSGAGLSCKTDGNSEFKADCVTLDEFAEKNSLDIGLIKLDVEGAELEVIQGAERIIREHKPVISLSVYHHPKDLFYAKELIENFSDDGYKFLLRTTSPYSLNTDIMLIAYPKALEVSLNA